MKMPKIGQMRHKIQLLTSTTTRASGGIREQAWSVEDTLWGIITPKNDNRLIQAIFESNNKERKQTYEIFVRYNSNVKIKKRLRYENRDFIIDSFFDIDERKRFLKITATETEKAKVVLT